VLRKEKEGERKEERGAKKGEEWENIRAKKEGGGFAGTALKRSLCPIKSGR
jgi:hypothetical protein